jgi:hypothetical protein
MHTGIQVKDGMMVIDRHAHVHFFGYAEEEDVPAVFEPMASHHRDRDKTETAFSYRKTEGRKSRDKK